MSGESGQTVEVESIALDLSVHLLSTGWQTALGRAPQIKIASDALAAPAPGVVSFPLAAPRIQTVGFTFPEAATGGLLPPVPPPGPRLASGTTPGAGDGAAQRTNRATRVKPPEDIIKLQDRLYYLLQPAIETIISDGALNFPFEPFPYQMEGIAFLYPRTHAVLADEMGLGKTMQAITTIRLLLHAGEVRRVLLICPKPLMTNWQREFHLWAPELPLNVIEGNQDRRHWQWRHPDALVTIANYEILMRDRDWVTEPGVHYDLVVLDESQRIKNRTSTTSEIVRSISRTRSWALTGTPVENSVEDLVGIFEFLTPGYLRPGMKPRAIGRAVSDYVLRRTKDRVLTDMPPKMFRDAEIDLTPEQWETYRLAEDEGVVKLNDMGDDLTVQHVFELVLRLKQICNFDPVTGASAKMERLRADLEECAASGRKAIVFSQWVKTLTKIKEQLAPFHPLEYHGQMPSKQRDQVIDQFKHDKKSQVILMSYGAGAVGLNLQFCQYVFLFDRWWNPAVEDQAINRAHRIGAAGPVTVSRFVSLNTIEQRIDQVLQEKRELFETVFAGDNQGARRNLGMTQEEIFGLFQLRSPRGPINLAA